MTRSMVVKAILVGGAYALTYVSVVTAQSGGSEQTAQPDVKLLARMSKSHFLAGDKIAVELVITNGSEKSYQTRIGISPIDYHQIKITGPDKEPTPLTRLGNKFQSGIWASGHSMIVQPGGALTNEIVLSQVYDLTLLGDYELSIRRGTLQANALRFRVRLMEE